MKRHFLVLATAVALVAGCTPSTPVTPTASPPTATKLGLVYTPLTPKRIADTRPGSGHQGAGLTLGPDATTTVQVTGSRLAPAAAGAVVLNVTALAGTASSSLTVYPVGSGKPDTSNLSWGPGDSVANLVTVRVGDEGRVAIWNMIGSVDVVTDLVGYYARSTGSSGAGHYFSVPPFRLLDTRETYTVGPGPSPPIKVAGTAVPAAAEAAVLNVTAVDATANSYLAVVAGVFRCSSTALNPPCVSTWNLPLAPGTVVSNRVITPLGKGPDGSPGWISFFNLAGSTDIVVDVEGWYGDSTVPATMGSTFTVNDPCRAIAGGFSQAGLSSTIQLLHRCGIPIDATAAIVNVTTQATAESADLYLRPENPGCGWIGDPSVSLPNPPDLRWVPGKDASTMDQVALTDGSVLMRPVGSAQNQTLNFSLDVTGYFTPSRAGAPLVCLSVEGTAGHNSAIATVYDTATGQLLKGNLVAFGVTPMPGSAGCSQTSLEARSALTNDKGSTSVAYTPVGTSICLITARDSSGASASASFASGILSLTPSHSGSTVQVGASYFRADGTPHPNAALEFDVIVNSLGGARVAHGACTTDSSGRCAFSYKLGAYTGATIVFAQDAAGLQVSVVAPGI